MKTTTRAATESTDTGGLGTRSRGLAAAAIGVCLALTGCSEPGTSPDSILSPQGNSTDQPGPPDPLEPGEPSPSSPGAATAESTASGAWGAYSSQAEACTAVAADVVSVAFLPVSLGFGADQAAIENAEAEIERIKHDSPWLITADFARLQLIVDDYAEATEAEEDASLDSEAFEEALEPIQDWLTESCDNPDGGDDESDPEETMSGG